MIEKHFEHTNFNDISTITALAAGVTIKNGHMGILKYKLSGSKVEVIYKYALAFANNEQREILEEVCHCSVRNIRITPLNCRKFKRGR